jgi:1-acyl-sn-glycerol-3-phosphate acyltransferase
MRLLKIAFWIIWRIWFYILMAVPIIVMFPFLVISIIFEKWYPYFFIMARIWARFILFGMGFYYKVKREEKTVKGKSYMFVANHTSMIDIMLMLSIVRNPFVFVGKKELAKIPLFGFFYKRTCILVDRSCSKSKVAVYDRVKDRLGQGLSICIFPEGGVPEDASIILDTFKDGAFRLAVDYQIPIVPITFPDNKKRFSYQFFSGGPGLLRVKIHRFIETKGKTSEYKKIVKEETRKIILDQLLDYNKFKKETL